jgi:plastocyanin
MKSLITTLVLLGGASSAFADLIIPSDGSDGALAPAASIEIDLSQAVTGTWSDNNGANAGKGIYDATKWAIVFKYSSVNIPAGVTVTFKNHPSYAPVIWLVQGSVTIAGTVSVNGKQGSTGPAGATPVEPGPGGFRGGAFGPAGFGAGLGPGGGWNNGVAGAYSTVYGNPQILPLIGGSGMASWTGGAGTSGGGAGGAILIAATSTIHLTGTVSALGGESAYPGNIATCGGAAKLIAHEVTGTGTLTAGNSGRTRIEANSLSSSIATTPATIAVAPGTTPIIFQSANSPTVRIVSVDGVNAPADPTAPLISSADISIQKNTPVTIVLETRNFATAGAVVSVRVANKYGSAAWHNATLDDGGTSALSTWRVTTTLAPGFVTLQARATAP